MAPNGGRSIASSAFLWVFLWVFLSWMNCLTVVAQLTVDEGPRDAHARIGDEVTFVCDLRNAEGYGVFWLKRQRNMYLTIGRQVIVDLMPEELRNRLSVVGSVDQEEFNLRIENVQPDDGGDYICQYALPTQATMDAGTAVLTVLIPPSPESPYCEVNLLSGTSGDRYDVGDEVNFHCYQRDGNPPPDLRLLREYSHLTVPSRTITHRYLLTGDDNGVTFTCSMTTPALDEQRNCSVVPLRILPNATILPPVSMVEEGALSSFACYGEGVPSITNYRWRVSSVDTGEILPANRYSVSENGQSLEIPVVENLELLCTVSVVSGLSGNSTARVEVVNLKQTTMSVSSTLKLSEETTESRRSSVLLTDTNSCSCPSNTQSSPVNVGLTVVTVILAVAVIVLITFVVWQRQHYQKSIRPSPGHRMTRAEHDPDDIQIAQEQGQEMQDHPYATVLEGNGDAPATSEYLELQDSPASKKSLEYAYASYPERKNDPSASKSKLGKALPYTVKIKKQTPTGSMQDSSGYEVPSKLSGEK